MEQNCSDAEGPPDALVASHRVNYETRTASELAKELDCWTETELALLTQCTCTTLENWRKRSKGPGYIRAGNSVLYRRSDVALWLKRAEDRKARRDFNAKELL